MSSLSTIETDRAPKGDVLIAEDDDDLREMLADALRTVGYRVAEAADGNEALKRGLESLPDILVIDHRMPGLTGTRVHQLLVESGWEGRTILISAAHTTPELAQARGIRHYLTKPFGLAELIGALDAAGKTVHTRMTPTGDRPSLLGGFDNLPNESHWLRHLGELMTGLSSALTTEEIAAAVCDPARRATGAASCVLWLAEKTHLERVGESGLPDGAVKRWTAIPLSSSTPLTDAVKTERPVWIESRERFERVYPGLVESDIPAEMLQAVATLPVKTVRRTYGALGLSFCEARQFDDPAREYLNVIARQCAVAVERSELYAREQELRKRADDERKRRGVLDRLTRIINQSLDAESISDALVREVAENLGDACLLRLVGDEGKALDSIAVHHRDPDALRIARGIIEAGDEPSPDETLAAQVIRSRAPILLPEIDQQRLQSIWTHETRLAIHSALVVPLTIRERAIGALSVFRDQEGRPYTVDDERLLVDVANRAAFALENARLYAQAQRAVQMRERLLSFVSHDLRTPVGVVSISADVLHRTAPPDHAGDSLRSLADRLRRTARHIEDLTRELLESLKIEEGGLALHRAPHSLSSLVNEAASLVAPVAADQDVVIEVDCNADVELECDGTRIVRVIDNLLRNAIQFSPKGGVVEVTGYREGNEAFVRVRDTGPGIAPEDLPHIFDRYFSRSGRGRGLGLAIAKEIVETHGGRIWAEAAEPGTAFNFALSLP